MNSIIKGALAGLAATVPMTVAMKAMHQYLPPHEQYPLPPRLIMEKLTDDAGVSEYLNEQDEKQIALAAHFSYGAAMGTIYAPLAKRTSLPPVVSGMLFGMAVWGGSYLGLLPAAGILRPATEHPPKRTALMITAHLIWGVSLGTIVGNQSRHEKRC